MIVLSGFKTGVAKFNLEFEDYMIVWSQFQIVVRPFKTVRPRFNVQFLPSFFLLRAEFFGSREMHDRQRLRMFRQEKSMSSESILRATEIAFTYAADTRGNEGT